MDKDIKNILISTNNWLACIAKELVRFNKREEAKQPKLPEGWDLDIPVS